MTQLLQAALRVFSLYLCNGSYMEVTRLRPLTRLTHWLRGMLNSRGDIARIQRRACKLATCTSEANGPLPCLTSCRRGRTPHPPPIAPPTNRLAHTAEAAEAQILGCQLLKEAHKHDPGVLFPTVSVPDALGIGHEVLEAQRALLRELTSEIFPRFQSSPLYEALCEEIGGEAR